jgi:hypothetical protein
MVASDSNAAEGAVVPPPVQQRWEYFTHIIAPEGVIMTRPVDMREINNALVTYGAQGWELASTFVHAYLSDTAYRVVLIFKRPKQT